jgi:ribosomal protein S12 methylthiotransferase rimO
MKINMISLGCDKNTVDAEMMLGLSAEYGFDYTDNEFEADVIIVNTCCFILEAKEESIETILDVARLKKEANLKVLIVSGCMAQRYKDEILKEIPEVDALVGTSSYDKIVEVINEVLAGKKNIEFLDLDRLPNVTTKRKNSSGNWYAYLKIAEGCDKNCTYCIIPSLRGHYKSYPIEVLIRQARELASEGVKELILVAQETTLYGTDIYGKKSLPTLLEELVKIEEIEWIRILYCYPEEITDELIETIAAQDKICNYLDIPIQHASDKILRRMARRTRQSEIRETIKKLRDKIPDIVLRTTFITGFPGEDESDFADLVDFVSEIEFDRLGVFTYSEEEGTPAATFEDQIDEDIKVYRRDEIMLLQQDISKNKLSKMVGKTLKVVIEGKLADEDVYVGRTYMDIPDVDGCIFISSDFNHISGDFVEVLVTDSSEYDLIGEIA